MGESEEENKQEVLATQADQQSAAPATAPEAEQTTPREEKLAQAKKFLQDAEVQNTTPERKAEFLKSKGLVDSDIEGLLNEVTQDGRQESQASVRFNHVGYHRHELTGRQISDSGREDRAAAVQEGRPTTNRNIPRVPDQARTATTSGYSQSLPQYAVRLWRLVNHCLRRKQVRRRAHGSHTHRSAHLAP